jgi:phosphopantetheinyl transferase
MKKLAKEIGVDVSVIRKHLHKYAACVAACESVYEKRKYNKAFKNWITHMRMGKELYNFSLVLYSE